MPHQNFSHTAWTTFFLPWWIEGKPYIYHSSPCLCLPFQNLLYEHEGEDADIKIVDFGFAQVKSDTEGLTTPCFTLNYAAPEVLKRALIKQGSYNEACDLWSLGVIMVRRGGRDIGIYIKFIKEWHDWHCLGNIETINAESHMIKYIYIHGFLILVKIAYDIISWFIFNN